MRYTASKNGGTLKTGLGVVQGHRHSLDHIRLSVDPSLAIQLHLVPFSSYLTLNNIVTLKFVSEVTQDHSNSYRSKTWVQFPIRLP